MSDALLEALGAARPQVWSNPDYRPAEDPQAQAELKIALADWDAAAGLLAALFPETGPEGRIRSRLVPVPEGVLPAGVPGSVFMKADNDLPVAGSVKARGGLFEVVTTAIAQAREAGLLAEGEDAAKLARPEMRDFFRARTMSVGSTGNLGLSVGITARALGYRAVVHMSADAKAWKVKRLTDLGVSVIQHASDYTAAVAAARDAAALDPLCHFVDDEDSPTLFRGYSASAAELAEELAAQGIEIGPERPLMVYLPCGVGGAPGGTAQGLRAVFGANVHGFFCEPVQAPSGLVRLAYKGKYKTVYDVGLTNKTEADGMAVATFSDFVAGRMEERLAGAFTVGDDTLFTYLLKTHDLMGEKLEPSAASAFRGPEMVMLSDDAAGFRAQHLAGVDPAQVVHVVWATGGRFVPEAQYEAFVTEARKLALV